MTDSHEVRFNGSFFMGLAFKSNIDDLRESPAKYIATKVMQGHNNGDFLIVEPNISEHKVFKLNDLKKLTRKLI